MHHDEASSAAPGSHEYHPRDAPTDVIGNMITTSAKLGCVGLFAGSVHAAWVQQPAVKEFTGVLLRDTAGHLGRYSVAFAAVGAAWSGTEGFVASLRHQRDPFSAAAGGAAAGAALGIQRLSLPIAVSAAVAGASIAAAAEYFGSFKQANSHQARAAHWN
ncbi:hypothetical protein CAOG_06558 [Capsaspora owczarzaki ATCC 30864]|uniref:Uncharacterized protein n=1 Tax=Capsaspora owczarzaki (strain ATCC 30864) TaxID=595528 RepID=A0A0D2WUA4_CAPO3|nr:hypothetical protein CAOG_06558 [Capsaspora owczarzaki ATCC 30864]KJE96200.1 hypothetical protein CAOG_006558 [Capsaspora owczarzaki ATCC 30864]|eukprot:XP_004345307.1 hypothetical protein CAOG_06558 [Capsaspora owczarzaki ATCC 30864]